MSGASTFKSSNVVFLVIMMLEVIEGGVSNSNQVQPTSTQRGPDHYGRRGVAAALMLVRPANGTVNGVGYAKVGTPPSGPHRTPRLAGV